MQKLFDSRKNSWAAALVTALIAVSLSFLLALLIRGVFAYSGFGSSRTVDIANLQQIQVLQDGFIYYDGASVSSISSVGRTRWSYSLGANAAFDATSYGTAAWQGNRITLLDKTGATSYNGDMELPIISARVGPRYTAIITGVQDDPVVILMENGGRRVNQINMDHVTVVDYGFFSDGNLLWTMVCDTNGTVPICRIQTYRPGKEIVGSISDNEQLDYAVLFQTSNICVAGDYYLKTYDYTGIEDKSRRKLIYGWNLVSVDNTRNDPLMVLTNDAQYRVEDGVRDVRILRSDQDFIVRLPFGCSYVLTNGDNIFGFSSDGHVSAFSTANHDVKAYPIHLRIDRVYGLTRDNVAVVLSDGRICLVDLNL